MTPPRTTREAPGTATKVSVSKPPVRDSAKARVAPLSAKRSRISAGVTFTGLVGAGDLHGLDHVVDPRDHGEERREIDHRLAHEHHPASGALAQERDPRHE